MEWLAVGLVIALLASGLWTLARRPGSRTRPAPSPMTVAEAGDDVGLDFEDELRPPKLADNVEIPLAFTYANADGVVTDRVVMIDGVYGYTLDHPTYIRGLDSLSREVRTFRIDRMIALAGQTDILRPGQIALIIGGLVRQKRGLPLPPELTRDK